MKGKLDGDAVTKFALNHVEKLVLGLMIGAFVFLILQGLSIESFTDSKSPPDLAKTATNVMSDLETDHWNAIQDEEIRQIYLPGEPEFPTKVDDSRAPIDAGLTFNHPKEPIYRGKTKRRAPAFDLPDFAPAQVRVASVLGTLNIKAPPRYKDPFAALKNAPPIKIEEEGNKKKKRPPRRRPARAGFGEEGFAEGVPDPSMMEDPSALGSAARKINSKYNLGSSSKTGASGFDGDAGGRGTSGPIPVTYHFVAGTAVMPHKALFDEFEDALAEASGFVPERDQPTYIAFRVIRADVTGKSVDQLETPDNEKIEQGKSEWVVTTTNAFIAGQYIRKWATPLPAEVIAPPFFDPLLTMPIPPLLMKNYLPLVSHESIPFLWDKPKRKIVEVIVDEPEVGKPGGGTLIDLNSLQRAAAKSRTGMSDGGSGFGDGGEESYGSYGTSEMGFGEGSTIVVPSADFKMIRFYDFRDSRQVNPNAPQPGRDYVYCVSVAIGDPNYPLDARMAPPLKTLDDATLANVQAKIAEDVATSKKLGRPYRKGYEWSAWSKPSAPVTLPEREWFAGGPTYPPELNTMQGKTFFKTEPKADVVAVNWDWGYATELTADFLKARLGTVLDKGPFADEIVNPSTLEIKTREAASVRTGGVLVGIEGSHPLGIMGDDEEPIPAPGATLVANDDGSLSVHNEVDDAFKFRRYTFADEREAMMNAKADKGNMMEGEMMEGMGEFDFPQ